MTNLTKEVLPTYIANDKIFLSEMVKEEIETINIDLGEYFDELWLGQKTGYPSPATQEFDYKIWEWHTSNLPNLDITNEMHVKAWTTFPTFY